MKRVRTLLLVTLALTVAFVTAACLERQAPLPAAPSQPLCSSRDASGNQICIDGNGNVVNITIPAGTPTPTPPPAKPTCSKGTPLYQENVVQAARGLNGDQLMLSYINALSAALKAAGFMVTSGGLLPADAIAIKTSAEAPFSETYDVWRADNTPQVLYQETCNPARF